VTTPNDPTMSHDSRDSAQFVRHQIERGSSRDPESADRGEGRYFFRLAL
jgi:hypothetical protein